MYDSDRYLRENARDSRIVETRDNYIKTHPRMRMSLTDYNIYTDLHVVLSSTKGCIKGVKIC